MSAQRRRENELLFVKHCPPEMRGALLALWAEFLVRDFRAWRSARLINDCMWQASLSLRRNDTWAGKALGGSRAYGEWLELADEAMEALLAANRRAGNTRDLWVAEVQAGWASRRAMAYFLARQWDQAVRLQCVAMEQFTRADMRNNAAHAGLLLVDMLESDQVNRLDEAQDTLDAVRADPVLHPQLVRKAQESQVQLLLAQGRVESARAFWETIEQRQSCDDGGIGALTGENRLFKAGRFTRWMASWFGTRLEERIRSGFAERLQGARPASEGPLTRQEQEVLQGVNFGVAATTADADALVRLYVPEAIGLERRVSRFMMRRALVRAGRSDSMKSGRSFPERLVAGAQGTAWAWDIGRVQEDAFSLARAGRITEADALLVDKAAALGLHGNLWFEIPNRVARAGLAVRNNDRPGAYQHLLAVFVILEQRRLRISDPSYRTQLGVEDFAFELAVDLLTQDLELREIHDAPATEAFRISELSRSRALLDLLYEAFDAEEARRPPGPVEHAAEAFSPLGCAQIQQLLPQDRGAALAEFFIGHNHVAILVVRQNDAEPVVIRHDLTPRETALVMRRQSEDGPTDESAAEKLMSRVLGALLPYVKPGELLWLVPHRQLHYLPLHAITLDGGQTLGARHPVCYTPSASVMHFCARQGEGPYQSVLTVADTVPERPLLHARAEATAVAAFFDDAVRIREEATRARVEELLGGQSFDVIHIATHGFFDRGRPLDSGIHLSGNGKLTARDFLGMRLDSRLVVLSACESGLGEQRSGDELFGLPRALLYAGVSSVLVSLWKVDDASTGLLMRSFYQRLMDDMPKADALSAAQHEVATSTLEQVIAYCEQVRAASTDPVEIRSLSRDIADLHARAGNHQAAANALSQVLESLDDAPEALEISRLRARCLARLRRTGASQPDYTRLRYEDRYYWAPFLLVGDWR
ncbi:CHAT domain-containing protein [Streptomyces sp. NPDC054866]